MQLDIVRETQQILGKGEGNLMSVLPTAIKRLIQDRAWEGRIKKVGLESVEVKDFEDLVTTKLPYGLETTISDLIHYCRKEPEVQTMIKAEIGEAGKQGGTGANQYSKERNTQLATEGQTANRNLKRLKRDRPDLAEEVIAGRISANAAAIQAGFRKKTKSIPINTPQEAVSALLRVFDGDTLMAALIDIQNTKEAS